MNQSKAKTKNTPKVKKEPRTKHVTKFKIWCIENGITQVKICEDTKLSIGCIHATWNDGKANDSTIKLIAMVYNLDEVKLKKMIHSPATKKDSSLLKPKEDTDQ